MTAFAEKYGIKRILFTSSIAPYGAAEKLKRISDEQFGALDLNSYREELQAEDEEGADI